MDDLLRLHDLATTALAIGAWIAGTVSIAVVCRRRIARIFRVVTRAIHLSERMHILFGEHDPAESIASAIAKGGRANTELEIRQRIIASHCGIAFYSCDATGQCVYASERLADLFECDQNDLIGSKWLRFVAEEQRQRVWESWLYTIRERTPYHAHYEIVLDDGRRKWITSQALATVNEDTGETISFVGYCSESNYTGERTRNE